MDTCAPYHGTWIYRSHGVNRVFWRGLNMGHIAAIADSGILVAGGVL